MLKWLKLNSINKKISLLVSSVIIISLLSISILNYTIARKELNRSNEIILNNAVEALLSEINRNYSYTLGEDQWLTTEQAKETSLATVGLLQGAKSDTVSGPTPQEADATSAASDNSAMSEHTLNLGESGYFFIVNSQGDTISHPFLEDNIMDLKSKDGRAIIQELIDIAKSGGGTLSYALSDDMSTIRDGKTVYTKYFPHWDWVLSAVIYHKDLNRGSTYILMSNAIAVSATLFVALFLTIWLAGRITKPIKKISGTLHEVSRGDLTQEKITIKAKDETKLLGDAVNRLLDSFSHIVKMMTNSSESLNTYALDLSKSADIVSETTSEVTKAITQMAVQTEDQFKETLDTVQKVTHLGEDIKNTAEASTRIEEVAQKNLKLKEEGIHSVHHLKEANLENQSNSSEMEQVIQRISEHSKDIGEIIEIITNVAKQTNLLALNASIEATRAGEHGTGFAVVASEIRKLANETAVATDNIRNKIDQMQEQSDAAVNFIHVNKAGVDRINQTVMQTEDVIHKIAEGLQQLIEGIQVITENNLKINTKKDDILELLEHVAETAEDNSASTQEVSATAEEQSMTVISISSSITKLHDMAEELNQQINRFKIH